MKSVRSHGSNNSASWPPEVEEVDKTPAVVVSISDWRRSQRDRLIEQYAYLVWTIAERAKARLPDNFLMEDLVGAGNIGLVAAAERFCPGDHAGAPFTAYARLVIRGHIIDSVRRKQYTEGTRISVDEMEHPPIPSITPHGEAEIDRQRREAQLERAIRELPGRLRTVIRGYYFEGERMREIAPRLQVKESRVCQMHAEAIQKLRDSLKAA